MASQGNASDVTQEFPKRFAQETPQKFTPKPRRPCMDARAYKKLFVRREVQVFKSQDDQKTQKVTQIIKTQSAEDFQEEVGQNF